MQYPSVFSPLWSPVIRPLVVCCLSTSNIKARAPYALGGIALGLIKWEEDSPNHNDLTAAHDSISMTTLSIFTPPQKSSSPDAKERPLSAQITAALKTAMSPATTEQGLVGSSQWALSILTSMVVLARERLFQSPHMVSCVLECLRKVMSAKEVAKTPKSPAPSATRVTTKVMTKLWWCSVVWAAAHHGFGDGQGDSIFGMVKQVRVSPVSVCLIGDLIAVKTNPTSVTETVQPSLVHINMAVHYLAEVIRDSQNVGIHLLRRLVTGRLVDLSTRPPPAWQSTHMVCPALLDGTLLNADAKSLPLLAKEALGEVSSLEDVRPLTYEEMQDPEVWIGLLNAWEDLVGRIPFDAGAQRNEPPEVVYEIWRVLLTVQAGCLHEPGLMDSLYQRFELHADSHYDL